jgi:hypothetical protein
VASPIHKIHNQYLLRLALFEVAVAGGSSTTYILDQFRGQGSRGRKEHAQSLNLVMRLGEDNGLRFDSDDASLEKPKATVRVGT